MIQNFTHQQTILKQKATDQVIMIIIKGQCRLVKQERTYYFNNKNEQFKDLTYEIANCSVNSIIGEEILFEENQNQYSYSLQSITKDLEVIVIQKNQLLAYFPNDIVEDIKVNFIHKEIIRNQNLKKNRNYVVNQLTEQQELLRQTVFNTPDGKVIDNFIGPVKQIILDKQTIKSDMFMNQVDKQNRHLNILPIEVKTHEQNRILVEVSEKLRSYSPKKIKGNDQQILESYLPSMNQARFTMFQAKKPIKIQNISKRFKVHSNIKSITAQVDDSIELNHSTNLDFIQANQKILKSTLFQKGMLQADDLNIVQPYYLENQIRKYMDTKFKQSLFKSKEQLIKQLMKQQDQKAAQSSFYSMFRPKSTMKGRPEKIVNELITNNIWKQFLQKDQIQIEDHQQEKTPFLTNIDETFLQPKEQEKQAKSVDLAQINIQNQFLKSCVIDYKQVSQIKRQKTVEKPSINYRSMTPSLAKRVKKRILNKKENYLFQEQYKPEQYWDDDAKFKQYDLYIQDY